MIRKGLTSTLKHKITIQQPALTPDGAGGYLKTWETVTILWAAIVKKTGRESLFGGKIASTGTILFRVRYTNLVTTNMRIAFDNRIFNIRSLTNVEEQNMLLEILAEDNAAT